MNAKKAKALRRKAKQVTPNQPDSGYMTLDGTRHLAESTKGAYRALKSGKFSHVAFQD